MEKKTKIVVVLSDREYKAIQELALADGFGKEESTWIHQLLINYANHKISGFNFLNPSPTYIIHLAQKLTKNKLQFEEDIDE